MFVDKKNCGLGVYCGATSGIGWTGWMEPWVGLGLQHFMMLIHDNFRSFEKAGPSQGNPSWAKIIQDHRNMKSSRNGNYCPVDVETVTGEQRSLRRINCLRNIRRGAVSTTNCSHVIHLAAKQRRTTKTPLGRKRKSKCRKKDIFRDEPASPHLHSKFPSETFIPKFSAELQIPTK